MYTDFSYSKIEGSGREVTTAIASETYRSSGDLKLWESIAMVAENSSFSFVITLPWLLGLATGVAMEHEALLVNIWPFICGSLVRNRYMRSKWMPRQFRVALHMASHQFEGDLGGLLEFLGYKPRIT